MFFISFFVLQRYKKETKQETFLAKICANKRKKEQELVLEIVFMLLMFK